MTAFAIDNVGPTGPPGASTILSWRSDNYGNTTSPRFLHSRYCFANATASESQSKIPVKAGTLRNLVISVDTALGGISVTYTIHVNGVATALTATLAAGATQALDTTHTVAVADGDSVSCETVSSGASSTNNSPSAILEFAA